MSQVAKSKSGFCNDLTESLVLHVYYFGYYVIWLPRDLILGNVREAVETGHWNNIQTITITNSNKLDSSLNLLKPVNILKLSLTCGSTTRQEVNYQQHENVSKYHKLCNLLASTLSYSNFASHWYNKVLMVISNFDSDSCLQRSWEALVILLSECGYFKTQQTNKQTDVTNVAI